MVQCRRLHTHSAAGTYTINFPCPNTVLFCWLVVYKANTQYAVAWWISTIRKLFFLFPEAVAYEWGANGGMIKYSYPTDKRPDTSEDVLSLGFISPSFDAVLIRVDSDPKINNDFLQLEIVSFFFFFGKECRNEICNMYIYSFQYTGLKIMCI